MSAASELEQEALRTPSSVAEVSGPSFADPASRRLGMLINPCSWGVRHGFLPALHAVLEDASSHVPRVYAWNPATFASALDRLAASGVQVLLVVGGDGTVQGVVSALFQGHGAGIEALSLLRGGRTNVTAAQVGARGRAVSSLNLLLHWERQGWPRPQQHALPTLCVSWGREVSYGFLLLGGGLVQAVEACRAFREQGNMPALDGVLGTAFWFSRELLRVALGDGVLRPIRGTLFGIHPDPRNYAIMVATTLPNWPTRVKATGMRVGWVTGSGLQLLGAMGRALAGKGAGHHFGWVEQEWVGMTQTGKQGHFLLDGEPVGTGRPGEVLQVQVGPAVQFLQMHSPP